MHALGGLLKQYITHSMIIEASNFNFILPSKYTKGSRDVLHLMCSVCTHAPYSPLMGFYSILALILPYFGFYFEDSRFVSYYQFLCQGGCGYTSDNVDGAGEKTSNLSHECFHKFAGKFLWGFLALTGTHAVISPLSFN